MAIVDASGDVENGYTYDVYGEPTAPGSLGNEFDFAGQQTDPSTGLQYLRARYYDPASGTFMSRDPLAIMPHWLQSSHAYATSSPVGRVDPSGLKPTDDTRANDWDLVVDLGRDDFRSDWIVGRSNGNKVEFKHCWLLLSEKGTLESGCGAPMSHAEAKTWLNNQVLAATVIQNAWVIECYWTSCWAIEPIN